MSFEQIYYVSQIVAAGVIILTLFAILWQGVQTNRIARSEMTLANWMKSGETHYLFVDSPEKAEFMHRALYGAAPLSESEKLRFGNLMGHAIGAHEGAYMLMKRGLVEPAAYRRGEGITRLYMQSPRVRKWWRQRREYGYDPRFRALIDKIAAECEATADRPAPHPDESAGS